MLQNSSGAAAQTQSHPTLCNLMDCSPSGSSACGISQARALEWVAVPFSKPFLVYASTVSYYLTKRKATT